MRVPLVALLVLTLAGAALGCSPSRARHAPPEGSPQPPDGEGWFCAHATTPHHVSWCTRERKACEKYRAEMVKAKRAFEEVSALAPDSFGMRPSARVAGPGGGDDEVPPEEGPEAPSEDTPGSSSLGELCAIDPASCPSVSSEPRSSVPTYSGCVARPSAFCSAFYHEYNYYRRDKDNEWRHFCAETKADCDTWRDLWHLHLVKRPCERVP